MLQVVRPSRSVAEVARELGRDWRWAVNDTVLGHGEVPVDHPRRFGEVHALGLEMFTRS